MIPGVIRRAAALLPAFLLTALQGCEIVHCEDCDCGTDCAGPGLQSTHFTRLSMPPSWNRNDSLEGEISVLGTCETFSHVETIRTGDTLFLRPMVAWTGADCGEATTATIRFPLDSALSAEARWIAHPQGSSTDRLADSVVVARYP